MFDDYKLKKKTGKGEKRKKKKQKMDNKRERKIKPQKRVIKKKKISEFPLWLMRFWVQFLALLSGLRIQHYRELRCRSQTRLKSHIAVALA